MNERIPKKLKSFVFATIMVSTSFFVLLVMTAPVSSAYPATTYHYDWSGWNGNKTLYMTTGATSKLVINNITGSAGVSNNSMPKESSVVDRNMVAVASGNNISLNSPNSNYRLEERWNSNLHMLRIFIPIAAVAEDVQLNSSGDTTMYIVQNMNISTVLSGFGDNVKYLIWGPYNAGHNITGLNSNALNKSYSSEASTILSYIGDSLATGAIVFPFPYDAILGVSAIGVGHWSTYVRNYNSPYASTIYNPQPNGYFSTLISQNCTVSNGSDIKDVPYLNYTNTFSLNELVQLNIPESYFNNFGSIETTATNYVSIPSVTPIAKGAQSTINLPIRPAATIRGVATINGHIARNQEIVLSQADYYNSTDYFLKTNSSGEYKFFAEPGYTYSINEVFPTGWSSSSNFKSIAYGFTNTTWLNLSSNVCSITGQVTNTANGNPIAGALVTLSDSWYSGTCTTVTDSYGYYQFTGLGTIGEYTVTSRYLGGESATTVDITSLGGSTLTNSPSIVPIGILSYVPVTLSNIQVPIDQQIIVNSSKYNAFEAPNLQNIEWFSKGGDIIPSWIENNASNTAVSTPYWLHITSDAGSTTLVVYMGFVMRDKNLFNPFGSEGEAPNLSPIYAQYDNGANVFPGYFNFAGTTQPSGITTATSGTSYVHFNNGVTLYAPEGYYHAGIVTTNTYPSSYSWMVDVSSYTILSGSPGVETDQLSNSNVFSSQDNGNGFGGGYPGGVQANYKNVWYYVSGETQGLIGTWNPVQPETGVHGFNWYGNEVQGYSAAMSSIGSFSFSSVSENNNLYWGSYVQTGGYGSAVYTLQWSAAVYPLPGNQMPSYSFSSYMGGIVAPIISMTLPTYSVTFKESGLNSGTSWSLSFDGSSYSSTSSTITISGFIDGSYQFSVPKIYFTDGYYTPTLRVELLP